MKINIKNIILFFLCFLIIGEILVDAGPRRRALRRAERREAVSSVDSKVLKRHCRGMVRRTKIVILAAQKAIEKGGNKKGIGLALRHHRLAKWLFRNEKYRQANFHSIRARKIARGIILANKIKLPEEATLDKDEESYEKDMPAEKDLDTNLDKEHGENSPEISDDEGAKDSVEDIEDEKE